MNLSRSIILKGILALVGLCLAGVLGAVLVAYSGVYNVAASRGHPGWLNWFLETGMRRSVQVHSSDAPPPNLNDPDFVALGAGHFQGGCAPCHGAPGQPVNPVYEHMLPSPPRLGDHVGRWSDQELFWIVKHGIQYAGMPAWSGENRSDEIWAVVAFLRRLPALDEKSYLSLATGNADVEALTPENFVNTGETSLHLTACARCHENGAQPTSDLTPTLRGQPQAYLERALNEYRTNKRQSGVMEPIAAALDQAQISSLAEYYASDRSSLITNDNVAAATEYDATLAQAGDPANGVPPCDVCHGPDALADYPRLAGQSSAYIASQLNLWRRGGRSQTPQGELMAEIAIRLTDEQIKTIAEYYATATGEQ